MSITLDRPPSAHQDQSAPRPRNWLDRYRLHLWIGGLSVIVIAAFGAPILLAPAPPKPAPVTAPPANVAISASEFRFSPNSLQVAVGQRVTLTLQNTGVVEHDVTIPSTGFSLLARAGQTATGDFTFDKPGVFDFFCSIPGHKDAGMKGSLMVVDPLAPAMPAPQAASSAAHDMPGMATSSNSDIKPLP